MPTLSLFLRCVAIGSGASDSLDLMHIPNTEDVRVGDLVVTSGLGGRFPRGGNAPCALPSVCA